MPLDSALEVCDRAQTFVWQVVRPDPDRMAAYHEAGHAVAALIFEWPVRRVSVIPNARRGLHGFVDYEDFRLETVDDIIHYLAVLWAGEAAEAIVARSRLPCAAGDRRNMRRAIRFTVLPDPVVVRAFRGRLSELRLQAPKPKDPWSLACAARPIAERLLRDNWPQVEHVVAHLGPAGALSGAEVGHIVANTWSGDCTTTSATPMPAKGDS